MPLTLTMLRCPASVRPETRLVNAGELSVGRGPGVDWVLHDPEQTISRRHFTIMMRAGRWHIIDESSNGTYANWDKAPIGRGNRRRLRNNDRIRIGPYELEASLDEDSLSRRPPPGTRQRTAAVHEEYFDDAPGASDPSLGSQGGLPPALKPNVVPLRPLRAEPPPVVEPPPQNDWPAETALSAGGMDETSMRSPLPSPPALAEDRAQRQTALPPDSSLMDAFFSGLDLPDVYPANPEQMFLRLGETFRVLVAGLRAVLIARAQIKGEFRIEQTMIRARGNNPLKFSANDDDAIAALLGIGRRSDLLPAAVVGEALRDIKLHELASMTAMQAAAQALLSDLDPQRIRSAIERAGGMSLLPAHKKARAWDTYEALHEKMAQALHDDFDSVFGRAFARAYEEALNDLEASDPE
ncbi:MAG: type VI secretion system-associated FHA domain protein TagH [Acetobacteraceae bacterium]|nr:type VI secretion system-associated FHA domain protein TagH [Pseudomonadota bacterium]